MIVSDMTEKQPGGLGGLNRELGGHKIRYSQKSNEGLHCKKFGF